MDIIFYNNTSPKIALDKTLTNATTLTGSLREQCSLIDPVINVESANVFNFNYCYIADFGRYYFIKEVTSVRNGLWRVVMHVDVRSSFKTEIRNNEPILERSENLYNLYIPDELLTIEQDNWNSTYEFPGTFDKTRCVAMISNSSTQEIPEETNNENGGSDDSGSGNGGSGEAPTEIF